MAFFPVLPRRSCALALATLAVLLTALTALAWLRVGALAEHVAAAHRDRYPKIVLAYEIKDALNDTARRMRNLVLIDDARTTAAEVDAIVENARTASVDVERLQRLARSEVGQDLLEELNGRRVRFMSAQMEFLRLAARDREAARDQLLSVIRPLQGHYMYSLEEYIAYQSQQISRIGEEASARATSTQLLVGCLGLAAAALAVLAATLLRRPEPDQAA